MSKHLIVVDDDPVIRDVLSYNLEAQGYKVSLAGSAEEADDVLKDNPTIDLILLDVMMEGISGFQFAETLRERESDIPIIFITAKETEGDLLKGFSLGADDYICKPFSMKEVLARVKAVLGRTRPEQLFTVEGLSLNPKTKEVIVDHEAVELTKTEFNLLAYLMRNKDRVLSREQIIANVWPQSVYVSERTVDVHITRLRKKIGNYASYISNRSGFGYRFTTNPAQNEDK